MEFRELSRINGGYAEARILQAAVTLGLFDQLDASGRSAAAIAVAAGTEARATELLLNALVAMRLVRKDGDVFKETEIFLLESLGGLPLAVADEHAHHNQRARALERDYRLFHLGNAEADRKLYGERDSEKSQKFTRIPNDSVRMPCADVARP